METIEMTNGEIAEKLKELSELQVREQNENVQKFSPTVGYFIIKNKRELEKVYKDFVETLQKLNKNYPGIQKEEATEEVKTEYTKKVQELLDVQNTLFISTFSLESLKACQALTLSDQNAIEFMIKD